MQEDPICNIKKIFFIHPPCPAPCPLPSLLNPALAGCPPHCRPHQGGNYECYNILTILDKHKYTLILIIQVRLTSVPFFFVPTYLTDKVDPQSSMIGQVLLICVTPLDTKSFFNQRENCIISKLSTLANYTLHSQCTHTLSNSKSQYQTCKNPNRRLHRHTLSKQTENKCPKNDYQHPCRLDPLDQKRFVLAAKTGFCWRARHPPATLSQ
jgi:hypothetical protein